MIQDSDEVPGVPATQTTVTPTNRCARCGSTECVNEAFADPDKVIACRDREIANLHQLLRVATLGLERVRQSLDDILELTS
jgi:hypothetical protein